MDSLKTTPATDQTAQEVIVFVLVIPDQRVPPPYRVALHCSQPLYQFPHSLGAS